MPELVFPWKRFWCPRGGKICLADDGFLLDPESEYAKYYPSDVVSFDSINDTRCLVFLGEPGIGKSTALEAEFHSVRETTFANGDMALWFDLRNYSSDDRLERKVFHCDEIHEWRNSGHTLHLFLDSLDEGLLQIDNISRVLLAGLNGLPSERLRLRIASRPADWQVTLEQGFSNIWGESRVRIFDSAPLRRVDVACAAKLSGLTVPEEFVHELIRRDVVPLAIKPVTLKFLIATYRKSGTLPASRAELYLEGCRRLCEEPMKRKESPKVRGKLTGDQRLAIAARFAAVTQFSNRSAIWIGVEDGLESEDVSLECLVGGAEGGPANAVTVNLEAAREVLDTGLFSSRDLHRQGWRHQTYSEFLAAHFLNGHRVPLDKLRALILHPDGSGKVVPQLRETATWLAETNSQAFQLLVQTDPEVLLRGEMTAASHTDRAALAKRLLESFDSGAVLQSLWDVRRYLARLDNPGLAKTVQPYLSDPSHFSATRIAAIEIVRACRLTILQADLVTIAQNSAEPPDIRSCAASTVVEIGDNEARGALRLLALGLAGDDPQDDLKGYGLIATWPEQISSQELFSAITPMKNENYFGAYGRFLDSDLAGQLQAHDMVMAVTWARKHATGRDELDSIHKLATQILERAVDHVDQPPVLELLAAALIERMRAYTDCDRITARLRASGDGPRRAVARTMFHHAVAENHGAFFVMDVCAIDPQDILWLLSEFLGVSDTGIRRVIAEVIARRLDGQDVETFNAVLVSSSEFTELRAAIEPLLAPVGLDSALAEEMKADHKRFMEYHQPKAATLAVPIAQSLSEALAKNASDVFFHVWLILHHQNRKTGDSAGPFPGWSHIDQDIRAQILRAARDFLRARPPVPSGAWWKEGTSTLGMSAGYGALHLLAAQSPDSLDQLADGDWNFWVKIVVTGGVGESKDSGRSVLVNKAYERAKETFLVTFEEIVEGENERHKQVFVIDRIGELWTGQLARMLRERITDSTLTPYSFKCVLAKLLSRSDDEAKILARRMATGFIAGEGEDRLKAVFATAELISHDPGEWGVVWPVVQANEAFGVEILQVVASEHEYSSFATTLDEGSVAAICIWISKLGLDKDREDPDYPGLITAPRALARLWNTLINFLTHKGTTGSCDAIRRLIEALPHHPGLQHCLREAEDRTRRATWIPLDPKDVIQLGSTDVSTRLVISIHGIRTRGAWQKELNSDLQRDGFRHEILDYGSFGALQLLRPALRARKVEWFRGEYEKILRETKIIPSVIAHSFGTYIVASAMEKYPEIRFDRIVLCGSIVRRDYDWDSLMKGSRVNAVLNEYGGRDLWAKVAEWCMVDAGASGARGFHTSNPCLHERSRARFGHSDYFYPMKYRENWIPFLSGVEPLEYPVENTPPPNWKFWTVISLVITVVILAEYFLMKTR